MVAIDDSASMDCARVMRGINSIDSAVTPRPARAVASAGSPSGSTNAMRAWPERVRARSASPAGVPGGDSRTRTSRSAPATTSAAVAATFAPFSANVSSG